MNYLLSTVSVPISWCLSPLNSSIILLFFPTASTWPTLTYNSCSYLISLIKGKWWDFSQFFLLLSASKIMPWEFLNFCPQHKIPCEEKKMLLSKLCEENVHVVCLDEETSLWLRLPFHDILWLLTWCLSFVFMLKIFFHTTLSGVMLHAFYGRGGIFFILWLKKSKVAS